MRGDRILYSGKLKKRAQQLRKLDTATEEEKQLWYQFLRSYQPQFRRQKQFGIYIVDFYCAKAKLVIEVDGGHHHEAEQLEWDRNRTVYLNSLGLCVYRVTNESVQTDFDRVKNNIDSIVRKRLEELPL